MADPKPTPSPPVCRGDREIARSFNVDRATLYRPLASGRQHRSYERAGLVTPTDLPPRLAPRRQGLPARCPSPRLGPRKRQRTAGLRTPPGSPNAPAGPGWVHEIKHDGYRPAAKGVVGVRGIGDAKAACTRTCGRWQYTRQRRTCGVDEDVD
jgi:hypothetical protein